MRLPLWSIPSIVCLIMVGFSGSMADPSFSARFLPLRFEPKDTSAREAVFKRAAERGVPLVRSRFGKTSFSIPFAAAYPSLGGVTGFHRDWRQGLAASLSKKLGIPLQAATYAHALYMPNDEHFEEAPQWNLHTRGESLAGEEDKDGYDVNILPVWEKFSGHDTLIIAILDAGFPFQHPEMVGRHWVNQAEAEGVPGLDDDKNGFIDDIRGWDFVDDDADPQDYHGHGTYVSSVIAAGFDNGIGLAGLLPTVKIMAVRVLDAGGNGLQSQIAKGVDYAVNNGAHVINFSIGGSSDNRAMRQAFERAELAGIPIVVASGNDGINAEEVDTYPVSYQLENMVVVASHGPDGLISGFSNYGAGQVHISAPGESIMTCALPPRKSLWKEDFETNLEAWDISGGLKLNDENPLQGTQSLVWTAGRNVSLVSKDYLSMEGEVGAVLSLTLIYNPANPYDALIIEGVKENGESHDIAIIPIAVSPARRLTFALNELELEKFRLRFRIVNTYFSSSVNLSARSFKIDAIEVAVFNSEEEGLGRYVSMSGTSMAAPHVAAYLGLLRLASDRMQVPMTRERIFTGARSVPHLQGKVSSGGRLDFARGLDFYLATLPSLRFEDSIPEYWIPGATLTNRIGLEGVEGAEDYSLGMLLMPRGAVFNRVSGEVRFTPDSAGEYAFRVKAEGPTTLRKVLWIRLENDWENPGVTPLALIGRNDVVLRVGSARFAWPPTALGAAPRRLVVEALEVNGTRHTLLDRMITREKSQMAPLSLDRVSGKLLLRAFLDGQPLKMLP